jgi:hypothetical protein
MDINAEIKALVKDIKNKVTNWPHKLGILCNRLNRIQHPIWLTATRIVSNQKIPLEDRRLAVIKLWGEED